MKSHFVRAVCFLIWVAGITLSLASPVRGQDSTEQDPKATKQTSVTDEKLIAFAKAYAEHQKIHEIYAARIQAAQDAGEKQRIQEEGALKVKDALEKQGLSSQAYEQLLDAINSNDQLRERALELIKEERRKS